MQLVKKMGSDARVMVQTIAELPHETHRAMLIVIVSIAVIGGLVFWPDVLSAIGFSITATLLMCAFMALYANDVRCSFADGDASQDEPAEDSYDDSDEWL